MIINLRRPTSATATTALVVGLISLTACDVTNPGPVQDEFDNELPEIAPDGPNRYILLGSISIAHVAREFDLGWEDPHVNTLSGLLVGRVERLLRPGDVIKLDGAIAEVMEVGRGGQARRVRLTLERDRPAEPSSTPLTNR